ncbi:hypothetical protein DCAR_0623831 [Daucus carota subsp. sativus]|uniref:PGG domain-containing protein n=1 Tax=Daucus carota subsp. sativus TaxID=79200 RepID=A0AAF0XC77_DAUCS|nr:PREDICTED: uncharacterized protein LOC108227380 [Daucus carota subsp. sativus]XP_017257982.1 PREDICTED: uncharacterized protein LOC108227380 [Daucus carota subsp. sativus]WOH04422.1 hypothetical protein DCAR_0623831 [Daucus carota subsp. sativus]
MFITVARTSPMANGNSLINYLKIYKAAIEDDWETAESIFKEENYDLYTYFSYDLETPLHIAVGTNTSHRFVQELVDWIMRLDEPQMLRICNSNGDIALHYAATVGNTQAAKLLINKDPEMAQITNDDGYTPLTLAAKYSQKEMLCYLLGVTKDVVGERGTSPYQGQFGADLLGFTILADFYDVALYLVKKYPDLVMEENNIYTDLVTALQVLAAKPYAFQSGCKLGFWERIICSWIPATEERAVESPDSRSSMLITAQNQINKASYGFNVLFWSVLQNLAPHIKQMHRNKVWYIQTKELVKLMCSTVINKGDKSLAWEVLGSTVSTGVKYGIHELVEECCRQYPLVIKYDVGGLNLFVAAIKERQEKVYNLVYQLSGHKVFTANKFDYMGTALHFAGELAPVHRLNTVTGAALQMQRELQWFKEVEKFIIPSIKGNLNHEWKTPKMVFTIEHRELHKEAQQWMKDTSSSATVVAALIVTIAFAAIFTVPGGNNEKGKPLFSNDAVFILFAISDAIALFSSSTSVMMLLAVLNSRFAEEDFLYSLPKRLALGLISLFISIAATMVTFSATLSLVLHDKVQWVAAPIILLASIPVTLFLLLQYPLLEELVRSTYGRGIFYRQNKLLLH